MANDSKKDEEEESGEFADFMADISQEIAQRVESLDTQPKVETKSHSRDVKPKAPDARQKVAAEERKKTPAPVDAGVIVEWTDIADRMIEEIR